MDSSVCPIALQHVPLSDPLITECLAAYESIGPLALQGANLSLTDRVLAWTQKGQRASVTM